MREFIEVEMDDTLRKDFDAVLDKIGMDENTAFTTFAKAVVRYKRIPFEMAAFRSHALPGTLKRPLTAGRQFLQDSVVNTKERLKESVAKLGLDVDQLDFSQVDFSKVDLNAVLRLVNKVLDVMEDRNYYDDRNNRYR
ncbi:MAG: type II toxin-antitoxin system RelB/DinJ family antitoxin [Clostridia bacterium]|nr:type II toxin-antitoxin system RelB/DinJ family antitoxin [Clostridia bacterium]